MTGDARRQASKLISCHIADYHACCVAHLGSYHPPTTVANDDGSCHGNIHTNTALGTPPPRVGCQPLQRPSLWLSRF